MEIGNRIEQLKELAQKATPGPWQQFEDNDNLVTGFEGRLICTNRHCSFNRPSLLDTASSTDNAAYICAANPQTILAVIAELERLQQENEKLRASMQALTPVHEQQNRLLPSYAKI